MLNDLLQEIKAKKNSNLISTYTSKFYTLIPHDFGFQNMSNFILNTEDKVKNKLDMLQSLTDMKLATKIISEDDSTDES